MAAFDDGTPLDAAALQDLDRRLVEVKALIPKFGPETQSVSDPNLSNSTITAKQIVGGLSGDVKLVPGKNTPFRIDFGSGILTTPKSIILTPSRASDIPATFSFAVDRSTLSNTGVQCRAYLNSAAKGGFTIRFNWMIICF
jgi:hypothetical protein